MKSICVVLQIVVAQSHPVRGAWIEIQKAIYKLWKMGRRTP